MRRTSKVALTAVSAGLSVVLAAACGDAAVPSPVAPPAPARRASIDHGASGAPSTLPWNAKAIALAGKYSLRPTIANRAYMLVSVAEARALDALDANARTSDDLDQGVASRAAALGGAAVTVLTYLFPADQTDLEAMLGAERASAPNESHFDAAVASGRAAAQLVVDAARVDGSSAVVVPIIPVGPGYWIPGALVLTPQWPFVTPMLMSSGSQFRPGPPPAFGSPEFLLALQRVRTFSDTRTAEQLAILNFWNDPGTIGNHGGHWNRIAVDLILRDHLNEGRAVYVLESLNLALSDASIACMDAKYTYWYVRPYQADPLITTPIGQPAHPSYPSLHSCQGGAAVGVLEHEFPSDAASLEAMLAEMNLSREWAGLHYWFDTEVGAAIGRHVAEIANVPR
jgi:membrane-associated phospholipid phosphatase